MKRSAFMPDGRRTTAATALASTLEAEGGPPPFEVPVGCEIAPFKPSDDYPIPPRILKRARAGRYKFRTAEEEIWITAALLHPPRAPLKAVAMRWIVEAALSCCDGDQDRAARALRRLYRSKFEIPAGTLEAVLRATGVLRGP